METKTTTASSSRFTVFFFRGNILSVRLFQLLLGAKWESPSHVVYTLDGVSYEITTAGVFIGETSEGALYRACDDAFTLMLSPLQTQILESYLKSLKTEELKFCLWTTVRYCFRLLLGNFGRAQVFAEDGSDALVQHLQNWGVLYYPPFSCTTPMWEALGEQVPSWNAFLPFALYSQMKMENSSCEF